MVPVGNVDVGVDDAGVEVALQQPVLIRASGVSHLQVFQMSLSGLNVIKLFKVKIDISHYIMN